VSDASECDVDGPFFERLVEQTSDIIVVVDTSGTFEYVSPSVRRVLGYAQASLHGTNAFEGMHPADRQTTMAAFERLLESSGDGTVRSVFRFEDADGDWVWLEAEALTDPFEQGRYVTTVRHVGERRALKRRFQHVVENVADLIAIIDDAGRYEYVSPVAEEMLGYDADELVGTDPLANVHPADEAIVDEEIRAALADPEYVTSVEYRYRAADGEWLWLESRGKALGENDRTETGVLVASRNITEQKERERELRHRNERLDRFASIVSHDLRNPLAQARGYVNHVREQFAEHGATTDGDAENETATDRRPAAPSGSAASLDIDQLDAYLERATDGHDRMAELIDDVLTLARQGDRIGAREPVEIDAFVRRVWRRMEAERASLTVETPPSTTCSADPDRLQELFENLFRNAVEHGGEEVSVRVETTATAIVVTDDGSGLPEGEHEDITERGVSTAETGTGLGLAIVQDIAGAHGWSVALSESDRGGARVDIREVTSLGDCRDGEARPTGQQN
jgi:PAS domain S-box-containing protein